MELKIDSKTQTYTRIKEKEIIFNQLEKGILTESLTQKVKLLIIRDLLNANWDVVFDTDKISIIPPPFYNKNVIRQTMAIKRDQIISENKIWLNKNIKLVRENICNGDEVLKSKIKPIIEVCETAEQKQLFRAIRYYWSSPYSEYVGRRIKLIIRDNGLPSKPIIGIAALGSPIIHIPERDNWVGWNKSIRTENIIKTMDAYIIGAIPPYNYLLGGKLISYILASNEVREIYKEKYNDKITLINKRKSSDLVCIFTTSLYGRSSQYNRIKYNGEPLYLPIGETRGYGTFHLSDETFIAMQALLKENNICMTTNFGDGPNWRMRVIRTVGRILGFNPDDLLKHSFKRQIYAIPLAENFKDILNVSDNSTPDYYDYSLSELSDYWRNRWLLKRKNNPEIIKQVLNFNKNEFNLY